MLADLRARKLDVAVQRGAQSNPLVREFGARYAIGLRAPDIPLEEAVEESCDLLSG